MATPAPPGLQLANGEKFVVVAVENVSSQADQPALLAEGTWVLPALPIGLSAQWLEWIGSIEVEKLDHSNLMLVRKCTRTTEVNLDQEHQQLSSHLDALFVLLQFSGGLEYGGARKILGSVNGTSIVHQMTELDAFYRTSGDPVVPVTMPRLEEAARHAVTAQMMRAAPGQFERFDRGMRALIDGLRHPHGQDRLHQFVRALEGLILPNTGRTRRQFIHRCKTFVTPHAQLDTLLGEAFDMRSDTEHVHPWDRSLQLYPPDQRTEQALRRTRQLEGLACFAYRHILDNAPIRAHFSDDATQAAFWALPDGQRRIAWGAQLDVNAVP